MALPDEAHAAGRPWALSASWLLDHWTTRVYPDSEPEKIRVRGNYPRPHNGPATLSG